MCSASSKDHLGTPAAGNGLLDRRLLLRGGLSFGLIGAAAPAAGDATLPDWMHEPGAGFTPYGQPSRYEDAVVRFPSPNRVTRNNGASWTPLHAMEGTITPNGLHFERHHNGVPAIDPGRHELLVHGLVKSARRFTPENLLRYPMLSRVAFLECGGNSNAGWNRTPSLAQAGYFHGLVSCAEWTGVPLATVLDECGVDAAAQWVIAEGADAFALNVSIPLDKALDDAMLALFQNGERLRPENGYPLRLLLPGWEGIHNVKWLRRLRLTAEPVMSRNETVRYSELLPDGSTRIFSRVMGVKSLITSPSSGMVLRDGPGLYQISGLAWSGHGSIRRVEVSSDGGHSWADAALQDPVLDKAFTRFRIPWRWNGGAAVLKSRAVDSGGNVQPERAALLAARGRHGFYHYNAIVNWAVDEAGNLTHVYDATDTDSGELRLDSDWE